MTNPATGDFIVALAESPFLTDEKRVDTLFLATLSRYPTADERTLATRLAERIRVRSLGDILWALLNSSEFVMNR